MVLVATQVKRRRGTTAENDAFTGAEGEITVDTTTHELRVHDGSTVGGHIIQTKTETDNLLSNKANVALDNLTNSGKEVCANMSMPSNRYVDLTLGASGATYTAPADGYVMFVVNLGTFISISADQLRVFSPGVGTDGQWYSVFCPVRKNKTFVVSYGGSIVKQFFRFVYAQGAQ